MRKVIYKFRTRSYALNICAACAVHCCRREPCWSRDAVATSDDRRLRDRAVTCALERVEYVGVTDTPDGDA